MSNVTTSAVMRNSLVVHDSFPQPDQATCDLHFFSLLSLLAHKHKLLFCALNANNTASPRIGSASRIKQAGINLGKAVLLHALKRFKPDIVWFEFHSHVRPVFLGCLSTIVHGHGFKYQVHLSLSTWHAMPLVASTVVARGMEENGASFLVVDTQAVFAEAVARICHDLPWVWRFPTEPFNTLRSEIRAI